MDKSKNFASLVCLRAMQFLISLILGGAVAFVIGVRLPFFLQADRILKMLILVLLTGCAAFGMYLLIVAFKHSFESVNLQGVIIAWIPATLVSLSSWIFIFRNIATVQVPVKMLGGFGRPIEFTALLLIFFVIIPIIFLLISHFVSKRLQDAAAVARDSQKIMGWEHCFLILFMLLSLAPILKFNGFPQKFLGKDTLIEGFALTRLFMGDKIFQDTIVSRGNWLVFANDVSVNDYQNTWPFSEEQLAEIHSRINGFAQYLSSKDIKLIIIVPPNKNTIYPDYVPAELPVIGEKSRLDQLMAYIEEHGGIEVIDLRQDMLDVRSEMQVFYATDTHWNPHGAYMGYKAIMTEIQKDYPDIKPYPLKAFNYQVDSGAVGDVSMRLIRITIKEEFYSLLPKDKKRVELQTLYRENNNKVDRYCIPNSAAPRLLVFHDSFAIALKPFLKEHFSTSTFVHTDKIDKLFIHIEKPDIIVLEWTERVINRFLSVPMQ